MKILMSLDLSTKSVGVAIFNLSTNNIELYTNLISKAEDVNERIIDLTSQLFSIIDKYVPDFAIIEDLTIINNQRTLVNLGSIRGATIYALALNNCQYGFIKPSEWRKVVGIKQGRRKRSELKQDALNLVNDIYGYDVNDDEAEAILIGVAYLNMIKEIKNGFNHR